MKNTQPLASKNITLRNFQIGNDKKLTLIAGPCALENRNHALFMADELVKLCEEKKIPLIFKTSFDKANRSNVHSDRGVGIEAAMDVFAEIRETYKCPIITDVHLPEHCEKVAPYVDVLQIPAFLCRQSDLLEAAATTGRIIHVKKGQFLAPWDMQNIIEKLETFGNKQILLCERGTSFGYNTLVNDMRSLPIMKAYGYPVIFDATHSVQQPGGLGTKTGGKREFVPVLARAAVSIGVAGVFIETHQNPDTAPSDGPNMVPLKDMPALIDMMLAFDKVAKSNLLNVI